MQTLRSASHHAQKPSSENQRMIPEISIPHPPRSPPDQPDGSPTVGTHNRFSRMANSPHRACDASKDPSDKIVHRASEPSSPTVGAPPSTPEWFAFKPADSNSRSDKSAERRDLRRAMVQKPRIDVDHTRPETHQNLIHSNKEQNHPTGQRPRSDPGQANGMTMPHRTLCLSRTLNRIRTFRDTTRAEPPSVGATLSRGHPQSGPPPVGATFSLRHQAMLPVSAINR